MTTDTTREPVTVIGLGPMGRAMVRCLLDAGHPVTVWNRTPSKATPLVAFGATHAETIAEALAASELVILSLTDYRAMDDILSTATEALAGKLIVNLSSDTPQRTTEAASWLAGHGARPLVGGVMVSGELVGTERSYVFYSGPRDSFDAHANTLAVLGRPDYRGEDHALAQLYYQAHLDIFLTSLAAYLHATALMRAAGVTETTFAPYATEMFDMMPYFLKGVAEQLERGEYPGDGATATMMGATADHIVGASDAAGIDATLPRAVQSYYHRVLAAGHGKDGWPSLYEVIGNR
ncbi:NAD(P)-dependent oxidoreductase [Saccharomonospora glauca]|jgi:3-hydroxyisobutyrate dehydrogenase-like beta-hydroxyacid dehydrogenase|uniref:Beta-hydroxyacid dehydrogenase, 3-hydroxyisobutyrate dehydrogenase n=1 Tax=Saccharomonospora glauca K62 TaxID=928724 RepID=I1D2H7_9PSEU|nr:NAD(P)-binding domain-containing protein [Saccharomonospora glauca]AUD39584.1 WHU imine reductase 100 [synthetic construct]EIE99151.1 beta-hydroxyacid dehydrogenase, 3-hydroxyisobutyrate dehydrogenase [Saccharomonospora glauca K62]